MTKAEIYDYLNSGDEIEFCYDSKQYSITFYMENGKNLISFCESNHDPINVSTVDEVLNITVNGYNVLDMLESLTEDDDWTVF